MNQQMNFFTKLACKLVGWNPLILKECGEASYRALRKYLSAFLILGVVWGTIGYLFAGKYIGVESFIVKAFISMVFITIVICIERFIILKIGKSYVTATMRVIIALLMATLGATIFDQLIFKNDLEVAMETSRLGKEKEIVMSRSIFIDQETARLNHDIDSIGRALEPKYAEFQRNPFVQSVKKIRERQTAGTDSVGKVVYGYNERVDIVTVANPVGNQIASGEETKKMLQARIDSLSNQKNQLVTSVHEEMKQKPAGFLEELTVLFRDVIMKEKVAMAFYLCLFFFMMSLEILVVSSKMGEKPCDYDLIVEHQLELKEKTFQRAQDGLSGTI